MATLVGSAGQSLFVTIAFSGAGLLFKHRDGNGYTRLKCKDTTKCLRTPSVKPEPASKTAK